MEDIIEIYNNYQNLGIKNRKITEGKEIDLVREYIDYRKNEFQSANNKKLAIFLETQVSNAYPDIVFVEYNPDNYYAWNETRMALNKTDLKILYHIYFSKGLNGTDIVTQLGASWKEVELAIEKLYDSKLIMREYGKWIILDEKKITTHKIQAVEAKLDKWDEVLRQSIINKNFASESYALSIAEVKPRREIISKFNKFGVGLCIKSGDSFNIVKTAKQSSIPVSFNSILFSEWIGRILNSKGDMVNAIG